MWCMSSLVLYVFKSALFVWCSVASNSLENSTEYIRFVIARRHNFALGSPGKARRRPDRLGVDRRSRSGGVALARDPWPPQRARE